MVNMEAGMLVRSLAGHDKDRVYVIIRVDAEYVWIADGSCRPVEKPKKKKKKHVQPIHRIPDPVKRVLEKGEALQNEQIKQAIESERRNWQEDKQCQKQM